MELTTLNSTHDEIAEAIRGAWGKDVSKDTTIVYVGQLIVANGNDLETINKEVKVGHKDWIEIGDHCWMTVLK